MTDSSLRENLNTIKVRTDGQAPTERRPSAASGRVEVHFDDIERRLLRLIERADAVVGCMAWLTNRTLLEALRDKPISIVVQKEDFLRPDLWMGGGIPAQQELHRLYQLGRGFHRFQLGRLGCLSQHGDPGLDRVRCFGLSSDTRSGPGMVPRMHHKFVVLCDVIELAIDDAWDYLPKTGFGDLVPRAVVTGSYNWTESARDSLENIVVIHDPNIARAYAHEWAHAVSLSEPCNWEAEYVDPEWRIGS